MNNYITWKELPAITPGGKARKVPHNPVTGREADPHDSSWWMDDATAHQIAREKGWNVGFVLSDNDPYFLLDLDDCRNPETGEVLDGAQKILQMFNNGVGMEVSINKTGFHVIGSCDPNKMNEGIASNQERRNKFEIHGVQCEFYHKKRFVALGHGFQGDKNIDCTDILKTIVPLRQAVQAVAFVDQAVSGYTGPSDDDQCIKLMLNSKDSNAAMFDGKATKADLWYANEEKLAFTYPSASSDKYDRSSADAALMMHLAMYTGKNPARMDRLFRQSGLMREKYDKRPDYRSSTINGAITNQRFIYDKPPKTVDETGAKVSGEIMSADEQVMHFDGCVYVANDHRVMIPGGELVKPATFKALYGGYQFLMSRDGTRPTFNAFEALTENRMIKFPKAKRVRFKPQMKPGCLISEYDQEITELNSSNAVDGVNCYFPQNIETTNGDVSMFLNHIKTILPVKNDQQILLAWAARVVQSPGVKLPWHPVIQGAEGNGKSILGEILHYSIGEKYSWTLDADSIQKQFNSFVRNRIFINVEEMNLFEKYSMVDKLKNLLTGSRLEVEQKGVDSAMYQDYCANWYFTTNHKDAVIITKESRRFSVFYTHQQTRADMVRDGMLNDYFPKMWNWLRNNGGFAAMRGYLLNYQVPSHLDPAGECFLAPETSSHVEAITNSLGVTEQYIIEATNEERQGFKGGWLSTYKVNELLKENGRKISPRRLGVILEKLGYVNTGKSSKGIFMENNTRPSLWHNETATQEYEIAQGYRT